MRASLTKDRSGNVAILFGLLLPILIAAGGGGLEIARALEYKQRLVSATDLTCGQAEKYVEATIADNPRLNYTSAVQAYATQNKTEKSLSNANITATPVPSVKPTSIVVTSSGSIDLVFKIVLSKDTIDFTLTRTCAVDSTGATAPGSLLISESFENNHNVVSNGWSVFQNWNGWATTNAGIEVNGQSQLTGDSIRFGSYFAELDSDCLGKTKLACPRTNSAMSRTVNLTKGTTYQIRYWYVARKKSDNPYPGKSTVCSTSASTTGAQRDAEVDAAYAAAGSQDGQTRRIELYVEPYNFLKLGGGFIDFALSLLGLGNTDYTNLADVCIWSDDWTERVYTFKATQTSQYRITWAAAGLEDTYGGLIDYLRICQGACP